MTISKKNFIKRLLKSIVKMLKNSIKLYKEKRTLLEEINAYQKNPPVKLPQFHEFHINSAVLRTKREYMDAIKEVESLRLVPHKAPMQKTWDSLAALSAILKNTPKGGIILDAGAILSSKILPWLAAYGYKSLLGIDLSFKSEIRVRNIRYRYGNLTHTDFENNFFDAITCISVIEHGVDIDSYLKEMSRILKPGGILITSADYWSTQINTYGIRACGGAIWHIFDRKHIIKIIDTAKGYGLVLNSDIALDVKDTIVSWFKRKCTFIYFVLHKKY